MDRRCSDRVVIHFIQPLSSPLTAPMFMHCMYSVSALVISHKPLMYSLLGHLRLMDHEGDPGVSEALYSVTTERPH